jgi:hypothetical protein
VRHACTAHTGRAALANSLLPAAAPLLLVQVTAMIDLRVDRMMNEFWAHGVRLPLTRVGPRRYRFGTAGVMELSLVDGRVSGTIPRKRGAAESFDLLEYLKSSATADGGAAGGDVGNARGP